MSFNLGLEKCSSIERIEHPWRASLCCLTSLAGAHHEIMLCFFRIPDRHYLSGNVSYHEFGELEASAIQEVEWCVNWRLLGGKF